jgi:hypothetical protein
MVYEKIREGAIDLSKVRVVLVTCIKSIDLADTYQFTPLIFLLQCTGAKAGDGVVVMDLYNGTMSSQVSGCCNS